MQLLHYLRNEYGIALAAAVPAFIVTLVVGAGADRTAFALSLCAAVAAAYFGGLRGGLLATALGVLALVTQFYFPPAAGSVRQPADFWAGVLLFAGLASLALPGTAPFASEFLVLVGTYTVNRPVAVVATLGIILAAAYVLWIVQRTTQGKLNPALADVPTMRRDITLRESIVVAPLVALLVLFGFYPKPLLDVINPAVAATMQDVGKSDPAPEVQEAGR